MFTNTERLYYEKKENGLTAPFVIDIDREILEKVVSELDEKCIKKDTKVVVIYANNEEEVAEHLLKCNDLEIEEIGSVLNLKKYSCIIPITKYTKLAKIIQIILDIDKANDVAHFHTSGELEKQSSEIMGKFINYSPMKDEEEGFDYIAIKKLYDTACKGIRLKGLTVNGVIKCYDEPATPLTEEKMRSYSGQKLIDEIERRMNFK